MSYEFLIIWGVLGLIIGIIAKYIMPGKDGVGIITTSLVGIGGSIVGVFIAKYLGLAASFGEITFTNLVFAVIGSLVVLIGLKLIKIII